MQGTNPSIDSVNMNVYIKFSGILPICSSIKATVDGQ